MSIDLSKVRGLAFDIDDTLSTDGKLTAEAYAALWALKRHKFALVAITGRPAGWCDHIARFWPVDAVIGENGAFSAFMQDGRLKTLETPKGGTAEESRQRLDALFRGIQSKFPEAKVASDQAYRAWDLAIDLCEDVPRWPEARVTELEAWVAAQGAHAKLSSIHLNVWMGDYTKSTGFKHWLAAGCPGLKRPLPLKSWAFIGDSPNDEPSFELFSLSAGVANLKKYLNMLKTRPTLMLSNKSGAGFVEFSKKLIRARAK